MVFKENNTTPFPLRRPVPISLTKSLTLRLVIAYLPKDVLLIVFETHTEPI